MAGGTLNQPYVFAAAMYAGMLAGLLYSLFRVLCRVFGGGRVITVLFDCLFSLCSLVIVCVILYAAAGLAPRFFHIIGVCLGFALFRLAVSPLFRTVTSLFSRKTIDKKSKKRCNNKK